MQEIVEDRKYRLPFTAFSGSKIRLTSLHIVDDTLVDAWRYYLTDVEKYYLWYIGFNSMDRVRLWNKLVFSREWFEKVIIFSKDQVRHKEGVRKTA